MRTVTHHVCAQGDLDEGLSEIASSPNMHPLAMLQFFPALLEDPAAAAEQLPEQHQRRGGAATPREDGHAGEDAGSGADEGQHASAWARSETDQPPVALVLPYLVTYRSRLLARSSAEREAHNAAQRGGDAQDAAAGSDSGEDAARPSAEDIERARRITDLALLRAWLQVHDYGALLGLLKQRHAVPMAAGLAALQAHGAYTEQVPLPPLRSCGAGALQPSRRARAMTLCQPPSAPSHHGASVVAGTIHARTHSKL